MKMDAKWIGRILFAGVALAAIGSPMSVGVVKAGPSDTAAKLAVECESIAADMIAVLEEKHAIGNVTIEFTILDNHGAPDLTCRPKGNGWVGTSKYGWEPWSYGSINPIYH
jgi:hypothetical protein